MGKPNYGYLQALFSSHIFQQIIGFQRNCHISRIDWCGNATNELKQPRQ